MIMQLCEKLAATLKQRIQDRPKEFLPSIASLSEEYHVSYQTVWKATKLLAQQGLINVRKGARTAPASSTPPESTRDQFCDLIRSQIQEGVWKSSEPLPKFTYFRLTYHIGQDTIARAMKILAKENLIHKKGKRWIIGQPPSSKFSSARLSANNSQSKVALLLFPNSMDANNFFMPSSFISHFSEEAMKHNLKLEVVVHDKLELEAEDIIAGIDKIDLHIKKLGSRYCGTLAHNSGRSKECFRQCLALMLNKKKPVILYDPHNNLSSFVRSDFGNRVPFFRLFFDEAAATALALDILVQHGHRTIGFPNMLTPRHPWVAQRIEYARQAAMRYDPPLQIFSPEQTEPFWTYVQDRPLGILNYFFRGINKTLRLRSELTQGVQAGSSIKRCLLLATPSMKEIIDKKLSAIIAGNDYIARDYYHWFKLMGIKIPDQISMISFDNQPEFLAYPMSTIDPGFARLGYLAAHILIDDITVKADIEGRIPGACTLVDRGSLKSQAR